ncbi:hypothetical protein TNCT_735911 [Trichonephila clavata]|uniref:DUF5641 domain-containing protein n=1 Tax=Trichonephila clavata TaxID=2740835 RepID=A0A8X6KUF4_TRICU|nr:hypothetical protein TNCT_735911 [Trichonephila clavata]
MIQRRLLLVMAKVLEEYPGKDNTVRVERLKTQSGEIVRPIRQTYPLQIKCTNVKDIIVENLLQQKVEEL